MTLNAFVILAFVLVLCFCSTIFCDEAVLDGKDVASPVKKGKDWSKIDVNGLEKEWEQGDEAAELEDDFENNRKIQARKQPKFNMEDGASIQKAYKSDPFAFSGGGGQMVFVDLTPKQPNGKEWTKNDVDLLTKRYSSLLKSGSIPAYVYNIETDRILVHIEKPWQVKDMLSFLAKQREVSKFTANSKTYTPKDWRKEFGGDDDDEDEDEDE